MISFLRHKHNFRNSQKNQSDWIGDTSQPNFPESFEALTSSTQAQEGFELKKKSPKELVQQVARVAGPLSLALKRARENA